MRISDWSSDVCSSDLPPVRDAVGVVAVRIADDIGVRLRPALAQRVRGRIEFVKFQVGGDPYRDRLALRPDDLRATPPGREIVKTGVGLTFLHQRASSQSITACTGPTSATRRGAGTGQRVSVG